MSVRSKHLVLGLLGSLAILATASPSPAQSLAQRVEAVRSQSNRETPRELPPKLRILQKLLYTDVTIDFRDIPIRDVMEYFRTVLDVNLVGRYLDDRAGYGLDPAIRITMEIDELPAIDALELVLEECTAPGEECTWQIRKGILEVGTKERLGVATAREVRVYPVDDLLYVPGKFQNPTPLGLDQHYGDGGYGRYHRGYAPYDYRGGGRPASGAINSGPRRARNDSPNTDAKKRERAEELMDLIATAIEPDAWERNGGELASVTYRDGALVVRAPDFIHRQIGGYGRVPKPKRAPRP